MLAGGMVLKKFQYSMQSILDIKEKLEEQERANYAQAQARLNAEYEKLEELKRRKEGYENRLRDNVGKRLDVLELKYGQDAIETMKLLIRQQTVQVTKAEQNVEAAMYRLKQAMQERKMHEKLREKAFAEYLIVMGAEERKEIDELVSYRRGAKTAAAEE